jgi:hypothetical protein
MKLDIGPNQKVSCSAIRHNGRTSLIERPHSHIDGRQVNSPGLAGLSGFVQSHMLLSRPAERWQSKLGIQ